MQHKSPFAASAANVRNTCCENFFSSSQAGQILHLWFAYPL